MVRGALIVFEGGDRSGKSTQCKLLHQSLVDMGHKAKLYRFPERSTPIGAQISKYLKKEIELDDKAVHKMFSDNRKELEEDMKKELMEGITLIVDRYAFSGVAYSAAKGLDFDWCRSTDAGLIAPDLVYFLDVRTVDLKTRGGFGDERYETHAFQDKVMAVYEQLKSPDWKVINANQSIDTIHEEIQQKFVSHFNDISSSEILPLWPELLPN